MIRRNQATKRFGALLTLQTVISVEFNLVAHGLRRCQNSPDPFPGWTLYKATKPGFSFLFDV